MLSASATDFPVTSAAPAGAPPASEPAQPWYRRSPGRFYAGLIVVALIVGAASLLIPSTPSYDPWAWIVWGREIVHLNLHTTGGPSWKPLPMIFTTLFAPFGSAAPDLWLVVARAGAFAAVVMVFRLSVRLTRQIGSYFTEAPPEAAGRTAANRITALGPALLAGVIAAGWLALSGHYISDNALGYSEGLATALMLIALDRHLDGKPRQAFAVGFLVALDRPEIWLFWGPYGLWLFWRDPGARKLVIALFLLIPVFWFLPEYWGSGHFLRGVNRAQHPRSNSLAFAKVPFVSELVNAAWPTILLRIKVAAALLVLVVSAVLWRRLAPGRSRRAGPAAGRRPSRCRVRGHRRPDLVRGHRDDDPDRLLGQQPLPRARLGAGGGVRSRGLGLGGAGDRQRHRAQAAPGSRRRGRGAHPDRVMDAPWSWWLRCSPCCPRGSART